MANSVDVNQQSHFAASDLVLHCLLRTFCLIRVNMLGGKYGHIKAI